MLLRVRNTHSLNVKHGPTAVTTGTNRLGEISMKTLKNVLGEIGKLNGQDDKVEGETPQEKSLNQGKIETFDKMLDSLSGFSKTVAKKILNNDFINKVDKDMNGLGDEAMRHALKKLINSAVKESVNSIIRKIAVILTVIISFLSIITTIVTHIIGGNITIPIVFLLSLVALNWVITSIISKSLAGKISGLIFNAVEEKITQFRK
jgi:hypothetical protein